MSVFCGSCQKEKMMILTLLCSPTHVFGQETSHQLYGLLSPNQFNPNQSYTPTSPNQHYNQFSPNHDHLNQPPASDSAGCVSSPGEISEEDSFGGAAEDGSSVCSADSAELGQLDLLPYYDGDAVSAYGTYSKVNKPKAEAANLDDIALGSLDYEQLMNYFEGLKESAA